MPPLLTFAALLMTSPAEIPPDRWSCRNQVEVWCAVDGCTAMAEGETTPMAIDARSDGAISVCAYTGCWEGQAETATVNGRYLWVADALPFSTSESGFSADITLLVSESDGVGFVRAGGIASPVMCVRKAPTQSQP